MGELVSLLGGRHRGSQSKSGSHDSVHGWHYLVQKKKEKKGRKKERKQEFMLAAGIFEFLSGGGT